MAELPIMPLKTDALLADTTHMNAEEMGAYCRILFVMWRHGGTLKNDDGEFANIAGVSRIKWRKIRDKVMRPMTVISGKVSQKRLTDTWMQVQEVRRKRAMASDHRWKNKRKANGMQMNDHLESRSNPNQNQISIDTSLDDRPSAGIVGGLSREAGMTYVARSPDFQSTLVRQK